MADDNPHNLSKILSKVQSMLNISSKSPTEVQKILSKKIKELSEIDEELKKINKKLEPLELLIYYENDKYKIVEEGLQGMGNAYADLKGLDKIFKNAKDSNTNALSNDSLKMSDKGINFNKNCQKEFQMRKLKLIKFFYISIVNTLISVCKHSSSTLPTDITFKESFKVLDIKAKNFIKSVYLKERCRHFSEILTTNDFNIEIFSNLIIEELYRYYIIFNIDKHELIDFTNIETNEFLKFTNSFLENFLMKKPQREILLIHSLFENKIEESGGFSKISKAFVQSNNITRSTFENISEYFIARSLEEKIDKKEGVFEL